MIEAFEHPRLTLRRAPLRTGIRLDDPPPGGASTPRRSAAADDLRFFLTVYASALVFFLVWLG